jgi:dsDNA-specific endonuclease/ATPase MutS2
MTENVEFTPEQQAKIDEIVKQRVARERERFEKESGAEDLKAQLESKEKEITEIKKTHAVEWELAKRGLDTPVTEAKVQSIKKLIDLDSETDPAEQIDSLSKQVPELFEVPRGTGSGYFSKTPVLDREKPLTREEVEQMSESEINSNWARVKAFMAGERS